MVNGLRFFYHTTLGRPETTFRIACAKAPKKLPLILSRQEVSALFAVTTNLRHRTLLKTTYSAGLRVSETVHLKVTDIDSHRMCIRVEQGKRRKDRYTLLSPRLLAELRAYWKVYRPTLWPFPDQRGTSHISRTTAWRIFQQAKKQAGITKPCGIHALRNVSPHYSSFVDNSYLLPPPLLWADCRYCPMVTAADLGESDRQTPGWP